MAVGVNIVSEFNSKGIAKAIKDFKSLQGAGAKATYGLRTLDSAVTNGVKNVMKFGAVAGAAFAGVGFALVRTAEKMETSNARIEQINKSMGLFGDATDEVTKRIIKMAEAQAMATGIDRNAIKETAAKLLTFKELAETANVVGGAFDRAQQAALDLAASGFGEATQNATQLGKALNDPVKGLTALRRSGVTFTEAEKEKIKTLVESGKMLEAQDTLLKAIETQVGGTAVATANASDKMRQSLGMAGESLGSVLLPAFQKLTDFVITKVTPYIQKFSDVLGEQGLRAAIGMLTTDFLSFTANMGKFGNTILALTAAFVTLRLVTIAATISQNLFKVALLSNPIGIIVAAVIALGVALAALYIKFEGVRKVVHTVINFIIGAVENWVNMWIKGINLIIDGINILRKIGNFLGGDFEMLGKIGEVEFGRIGKAADKAGSKLYDLNMKMEGFGVKVKAVKKDTSAADESADDFADTTSKAAKAVETAKEKLQKYIDAVKGTTSAQKSLRDASKGVLKANTDLAEANTKLAEAQDYFNQIINGYGKDSKQAKDKQKELAKAQRDVERSGYDVEASVFAVKKAEQELADLRKDPESTPMAIREAEIALAEAKLRVADATDAQTDATAALDQAQTSLDETVNGAKEGSDLYKEALDRLNQAKAAQVEATDRVTDAIDRERDAVDKLREAEEKLAEVRKATPAAVVARAEDIIRTQTGGGATGGTLAIGAGGGQAIPASLFSAGSAIRDRMLDLVPFATGGIVTSPTVGLIGEAGAEAVIPLDKAGSLGGTQNIYLTVNAGMGVDPAVVGDEIVNVLQRYNRRNGALPLKVA